MNESFNKPEYGEREEVESPKLQFIENPCDISYVFWRGRGKWCRFEAKPEGEGKMFEVTAARTLRCVFCCFRWAAVTAPHGVRLSILQQGDQ